MRSTSLRKRKSRLAFLAAVEAAWRGEKLEIDPEVARCGGKDTREGTERTPSVGSGVISLVLPSCT